MQFAGLCAHICMRVQPSTEEVAKREDFGSLPVIPSDYIRKHGATFSSERYIMYLFAGHNNIIIKTTLLLFYSFFYIS